MSVVSEYHDRTKDHFHAFARSLGYIDWATQPRPFREYAGAPLLPLYPNPSVDAHGYVAPRPSYDDCRRLTAAALPLSAALVGDVLRHAFGLSAWKEFRGS